MERCKGLKNWLECLSCPHLCTQHCPLEGEDVIEEMKRHVMAYQLPEQGKTNT